MKITIDTKEDSREEIKKVISLLTHLIGETPMTNANIFDNPQPEPETNNLMNMFDNPVPPPEEKEEPTEESKVIPY